MICFEATFQYDGRSFNVPQAYNETENTLKILARHHKLVAQSNPKVERKVHDNGETTLRVSVLLSTV